MIAVIEMPKEDLKIMFRKVSRDNSQDKLRIGAGYGIWT
jgi:hypothetical protein